MAESGKVSEAPVAEEASLQSVANGNQKVDKITALQDAIDGLSLSMFEALRGLRDAVAKESGNLGIAQQNPNPDGQQQQEEPDTDELWHAYKSGDTEVTRMVEDSLLKMGQTAKPNTREDFIRWHAKMSLEKDTELVAKLSSTVLEKSEDIDRQVEALPGMNRSKDQQMEYIEQLITENQQVVNELETLYEKAERKRDECREFIKEKTSEALGIMEE